MAHKERGAEEAGRGRRRNHKARGADKERNKRKEELKKYKRVSQKGKKSCIKSGHAIK